MGGGTWSDDFYSDRVTHRTTTNAPTFAHDVDVRSGKAAAAIHPKMNPRGVTRESRDSAAHPLSVPVAVFLDVTGSMNRVPRVMQEKLPQLMGLLLRKNYVTDPQILFGAIGDYHSDRAPLQVGQFESSIEMDDDITNLFLEGAGGGQNKESYQNAFYFLARHTALDSVEKRAKKGYAFIVGDELPYETSSRAEIESVFGERVESDLSLKQMLEEAKQKFEVFFIIPQGSSHATASWLRNYWSELLGAEHVLMLDDAAAVCETIGVTIGLCEGATDSDAVVSDLASFGVSSTIAEDVKRSTDALARKTALIRMATADLPTRAVDATTRL